MKRILSILLTALMVLTIIPVSVFMASAETVTFADKTLAAGESTTETIDLTKVDRTQPLTITMDVQAANATSTANGKDAPLMINGIRTIRVTGGSGLHIWDQANNTAQGTWARNQNGTNTWVITVDFAADTVRFNSTSANRDITVSAAPMNLSADTLTLQFGDADTGACSFKNISVAYTAVATEEPDQPDQPDQPDPSAPNTLYENDFSSAEKVADGTIVGSSATYSDGKLSFGGWNSNSHWSKTVNTNGTNGAISVSATIYPNWQSGTNPVLTVNGKTVIWNAGGSQVKLGDNATAYNSASKQAVYVTVTIDPKTGDATVVYDQAAAGYTTREVTVNVGIIGSTFDVKFGYSGNSWSADDLKVTQVKGAVEDTQSRETYNYYYNDFTTEKSNSGLISSYSTKGSSVVDGALCVNPAEVNQWNNANAVFASGVVFKFDFMLPVLPTGDEVVKLLFDRTSYDYFILVTESGAKMNGGNPVNTVAIEANKYYTATIVMADTGSVVYVDGTLVGTCARTLSGRPNNYGLFNFNHQANANTLTYYIDNIAVTDVADETFVKVVGYQKTNVDNGTYCVRFTTAVFDLYAGEECIGFDIEAPAYGKTWNKTTNTVYTSLTANYGTEEVLASDEGAKYITAMALTGLPASEGTIELVVTPYVVINGIKVCGTAVTVTVNPVQ